MSEAVEVADWEHAQPVKAYTTPLPVPGEPWFVLRTAPGFVQILRNMATQASARLWYPIYAQRSRVGPNRKPTIKYPPVFPGYAFVPRSHVHGLRLVPTYRYQLLRMPNLWDVEFVKLPWRVIHKLGEQEVEDCRISVDEGKAVDQFAVGDWVKTIMGPLQVTGIVGNNLVAENAGKRITIAAAKAERVAS